MAHSARRRGTVAVLFVLSAISSIDANWVELVGFEGVRAKQQTAAWCWAAALQMVAAANRVSLTQEQIVRTIDAGDAEGATFAQIARFMQPGWRGRPGDPDAWTLDGESFGGASGGSAFIRGTTPVDMMYRYFQIGRPVILVYRTTAGNGHAVVAYAGDFARTKGMLVLHGIKMYDPWDGTTLEEEWSEISPLLVGAWAPLIVKRDNCNVFGPGLGNRPECVPPVRGGGVF